jgi:hypothetical protein
MNAVDVPVACSTLPFTRRIIMENKNVQLTHYLFIELRNLVRG